MFPLIDIVLFKTLFKWHIALSKKHGFIVVCYSVWLEEKL